LKYLPQYNRLLFLTHPVYIAVELTVLHGIALVQPLHCDICICRGSGLPPPRIYRGPSSNGEENVEDQIDSDMSASFVNAGGVNRSCNTAASDSVSASDVDKTLSDLQSDRQHAEKTAARQVSSSPQGSFDEGGVIFSKAAVASRSENHSSEGSVDSVLSKPDDSTDHLSKHEACDTAGKNEIVSSPDQPSGGANGDVIASEQCRELDGDSEKLSPSREKSVSPPVNIPGSNADGVVNGGDDSSQPRNLGSIAEDSGSPTPSTSAEVGGGGSSRCRPLHCVPRKSVPCFTAAGSFIIPPDEDIYVDLSCGLFSTDPDYVGRVQDVSTLPSPPARPFTIGDNNQADLVYYAEEESTANALSISGQSVGSQKTAAESECQHSDGEVTKHGSASSADIKVEMIDATSPDVLEEIFKRTSGKPSYADLQLCCLQQHIFCSILYICLIKAQ